MSFKHKQRLRRQARSIERTSDNTDKSTAPAAGPAIPPWAELSKMNAAQVAELLDALGMESTGKLMQDKSAINRARV